MRRCLGKGVRPGSPCDLPLVVYSEPKEDENLVQRILPSSEEAGYIAITDGLHRLRNKSDDAIGGAVPHLASEERDPKSVALGGAWCDVLDLRP